jgi:hypothetical protein
MPYNNRYNRAIASDLCGYNHRYAQLYDYSPVDGCGRMAGGSNAGVLFQMGNASKHDGEDNMYNDDNKLPPVYYEGNSWTGGNGFAAGTYRDRGDGRVEGVAAGYFDKSGAGMSGGAYELQPDRRAVRDVRVMGSGLMDDLRSGKVSGPQIESALRYSGLLGGGLLDDLRSGKVSGPQIEGALRYAGIVGGGLFDDLRSGKVSGPQIEDALRYAGVLKGSGFFDSFVKFFKETLPSKLNEGAQAINSVVQKGRQAIGMSGGTILGNPDPYPVVGNSDRIAGRGMSGGARGNQEREDDGSVVTSLGRLSYGKTYVVVKNDGTERIIEVRNKHKYYENGQLLKGQRIPKVGETAGIYEYVPDVAAAAAAADAAPARGVAREEYGNPARVWEGGPRPPSVKDRKRKISELLQRGQVPADAEQLAAIAAMRDEDDDLPDPPLPPAEVEADRLVQAAIRVLEDARRADQRADQAAAIRRLGESAKPGTFLGHLAKKGHKKGPKGGSKPRKMKGGAMNGPNGDLLAMPAPSLRNGVPPRGQLRGSYGGAKPGAKTDGRKKRAEIVKAVMKEKGLGMIAASKYVKEHKLY